MGGFDEQIAAHPTMSVLLDAVVEAAARSQHLDPEVRTAIEDRVAVLLGAGTGVPSAVSRGPAVDFAEQLIVDVRGLTTEQVDAVRVDGGDPAVIAAASTAALTAAVTRARIALGGA